MKRRGIYLALCTDPEGHSCFTVKYLQNQSDKKLTSHFLELACPHTFWARGALLSSPPPSACGQYFHKRGWLSLKRNKGSVNRLFLNERRHFNNKSSFRFNWQCFGDHFLLFCCKFSGKFFFYWPVNTDKPNFVLIFVGTADSSTAKISSLKTVGKQEDILNPIPKRWISKDIRS